MGLLDQGAILQLKIGPVPLRPDLARPGPWPDSTNTRPEVAHTNARPDDVNTRPNAANKNTRPETAQSNPRPNPGRAEADLTRPERPVSRHPPARPISPYTDWSSLSDHTQVITVHSDDSDDNYIPRSPAYEPDSAGPNPVQETEDLDPTLGEGEPEDQQSCPYRTVFSNIFSDSRNRARDANEASERPRSPLGRGSLMQRVSPFLRGIGQRRRHQLGKIRSM